METCVKKPNLPEGEVSLGIIDGRAGESLIKTLEGMGIRLIFSGRCEDLYDEVAYHPDMYIHHIGMDLIVAAPNAPEKTMDDLKMCGFKIVRGNSFIIDKYPYDIAYNVARIGDYAICNERYTDKVLLSLLKKRGVSIINVNQGYAKCSICIVDEDAVITSDEGIEKALASSDFDVLKIAPGNIALYDMPYGFIGGASGLVSGDTIAFAGNISLHPDYSKIRSFLDKHGKKHKNLSSEMAIDIGTFIPLKEYCIEETY